MAEVVAATTRSRRSGIKRTAAVSLTTTLTSNAVADAATVYERVKEMISQGVPVSEVNQYIQSASDNGLISDDSRRRMKYMNNSR